MEMFSKSMSFWWQHYFCSKRFSWKKICLYWTVVVIHFMFNHIVSVSVAGKAFRMAGFMLNIGAGGGWKTLIWPLVTFPFVWGSSNIDEVLARYVIYMCTKNQFDMTNGLGGVREHTDIQTYKHIKRNKNMDR